MVWSRVSAKPAVDADERRSSSSTSGHRASDCQAALRIRRDRRPFASVVGDRAKEVVEGADRAREERRAASDQVALDTIDVEPIRDDQPRVTLERSDVALQKQRDLAGVSRPHDERESHRSIVVLAPEPLSYATPGLCAKSVESRDVGVRPAGPTLQRQTVADFGRRPRRATA